MTHTIRVIDYNGDMDDANDINIIGPFETKEARDELLAKFNQMTQLFGSYEFEASIIPIEAATWGNVHPAQFADMPSDIDEDGFGELYYGVED